MPVPSAPALAGTATGATGKPVNGISCDTSEQLVFHIHAHLTVFVNGAARQVPAAIGIPGAQAQNTPTGPFAATGTFFSGCTPTPPTGSSTSSPRCTARSRWGNLFDIWGQPLVPSQVGPAAAR